MIKSAVVAKLLTLKAAAIAVAAVSAGGVALAASTGVLPLNQAPENPSHSVPASDHSTGPNATPSPSLVGLCTAFLAGAGEDHGKALENPAFSALVTAAGDPENVDSFCAELGVTEPGADRGSGSGSPTDHPTGKPSDVGPTQLPTTPPSHPTGRPTTPPKP